MFYLSTEIQSVYSSAPADWAAKGISPNVNAIERPEIEFVYYNVIARHVSHDATELPLS